MCKIMDEADFLCVHPSDAELTPIPGWKRNLARGLAVDEAGSSKSSPSTIQDAPIPNHHAS
jgi:hypothetical protein